MKQGKELGFSLLLTWQAALFLRWLGFQILQLWFPLSHCSVPYREPLEQWLGTVLKVGCSQERHQNHLATRFRCRFMDTAAASRSKAVQTLTLKSGGGTQHSDS